MVANKTTTHYFCHSLNKGDLQTRKFGLVVQLVRISACHAEGRRFESGPDRKKPTQNDLSGLFLCLISNETLRRLYLPLPKSNKQDRSSPCQYRSLSNRQRNKPQMRQRSFYLASITSFLFAYPRLFFNRYEFISA